MATVVATAPQAFAHAGHDQLLRIDVEKEVVRLSLSLDDASLSKFDSNGDGKISRKEFTTAFDEISAWIDEKIIFVNRDHMRSKAVFSDMPITGYEQLNDGDDIEHVRILRSYPIGKGDGTMMIRFTIFDHTNTWHEYVVWSGGAVTSGVLTPESNVVTLGATD